MVLSLWLFLYGSFGPAGRHSTTNRPDDCVRAATISRPACRASSVNCVSVLVFPPATSMSIPSERGVSSAETPPRMAIVPFCWAPVAGPGRLGAAAQDGHGRLVGPVVEDALQQVEVGSGGEWIEEALRFDCHPAGDSEAVDDIAGSGHRAGEVDEDAFCLRVAPEQRGQHGPGPAADIDDGADRGPTRR